MLRPTFVPKGQTFRPANKQHNARRLPVVAGEGRSANRTKWATAELLSGSEAATRLLERPLPQEQQLIPPQQQDASELVSGGHIVPSRFV